MISKPDKTIKGVKKVEKKAKKVYRQKLTACFHHCNLKSNQKLKKTLTLKKLILRASEEETNFFSDQVSTNSFLLHLYSSFYALFLFLGGHTLLKKGGPMCTWVVQGKPTYVHGQKIVFPQTYVTVSKTTHVHPQKHGKIKSVRANSPLNYLGIVCMSTGGGGNIRISIIWSMRTLFPLPH